MFYCCQSGEKKILHRLLCSPTVAMTIQLSKLLFIPSFLINYFTSLGSFVIVRIFILNLNSCSFFFFFFGNQRKLFSCALSARTLIASLRASLFFHRPPVCSFPEDRRMAALYQLHSLALLLHVALQL